MNFKTLLLILCLVCPLTFILQQGLAQETSKKLMIGVKAGINFSTFHYDIKSSDVQDINPDNGFYLGLDASIPLASHWYLQPELFYIESRVQTYSTQRGLVPEKLTHYSLPLLITYKVKHLGIYAGPQFSFLSTATIDLVDEVDLKSSYKNNNVSGVIGLEYTFGKRFGVSARYQQGFQNIGKENGMTPQTKPKGQKIRLSGFQTGVYFRFGKTVKHGKA